MNEPIKVYFYPFSVMTIERSSLLAHHYTYAIHAGVSVVTPRRHLQVVTRRSSSPGVS